MPRSRGLSSPRLTAKNRALTTGFTSRISSRPSSQRVRAEPSYGLRITHNFSQPLFFRHDRAVGWNACNEFLGGWARMPTFFSLPIWAAQVAAATPLPDRRLNTRLQRLLTD